MKTVMHSYTFRGYSLETAIANAQRFGWDALELQPCHFDPDDVGNEVKNAVALGRKYEVPIHCLDFGGDFINADMKVVEGEVRKMEQFIDTCEANGIGVMNGSAGHLTTGSDDYGKNGSTLANDDHYARAAEAFRHLGAYAGERGIRIVFEVHMNTIHDTFVSSVKLLDLIGLDNVMANPDSGNMFSTSTAEKSAEDLEMLRGRIGYMHFKNCVLHAGKYNYSVKLADGNIDTFTWFQKLVDMGYNDAVCVEYCGEGDPRPAAEQDRAYVRRCLDWATRG
jgi:sugar phosphate isomerase/epimerase